MEIDLTGKLAIITGSTAGIGFGIAEAFLRAGAQVIVNGRAPDRVNNAVRRLGADARGVVADLGTADGHTKLVAAVSEADIVVSNLGIFQPRDFFETDDEIWDRHWQVNVAAGVRLARSYLPGMAAKGWGRLLFLSSESAVNIPIDMIHYGVTKAADVALSRGLAKRMAGTGVTVNSVLAGPTLTEGAQNFLSQARGETTERLEDFAANFLVEARPSTIIRRFATVEEIANMVLYLASPFSSATTGAALRADGGIIDAQI